MSQFTSPAGPSRPNRRGAYTPRACNNCRRRRCRCDGVQPVCGACSHSGHQCLWGRDDPESRPATKQYIESLRVKIQVLESEIAHLGLAGSNSNQVLSDVGTPVDTSLEPPVPFGDFPQAETTLVPTTNHLQHTANVIEPEGRPATPTHIIERPSMIYQYIFNIDTTIHIERQTPEAQASLVCNWNRHLPNLDGVHLSRQEHDVLLYRCFTYGSTWLLGLVPDLFLRDLLSSGLGSSAQARFQYYSPLLHSSLLAVAVAFADRPEVRARATRDRLAAHAKQWLDEDLNSTDPSLVVSLALLSEYHRSIGQTSIGHMYLGMCVRATSNLELMILESASPRNLPTPRLSTLPVLSTALGGLGMTVKEFEGANSFKSTFECFTQECKLLAVTSQAVNEASQGTSRASDTNSQMQTWYDTLHDGLRIRQSHVPTPPHVLCLHLHYWWITLAFNLPWLNATRVLEHGPTPEEANNICAYATDQVLALVAMFSAQHGLQFSPRITPQASVLLDRA